MMLSNSSSGLGAAAFAATAVAVAGLQRLAANRAKGGSGSSSSSSSSSSSRSSSDAGPTNKGKKASTLHNSVSPLDKHLILCGMGNAETWPARLESDESSLLTKLSKLISTEISTGASPLRVKVTGCDQPNSLEDQGLTDCIVMPDKLVYRLNLSNISAFAKHIVAPNVDANMQSQSQSSCSFNAVPFEGKLLLVCAHAQRDKRCGRAGPLLIAKANELIKSGEASRDIKIAASSHIGGHEFAGTCIALPSSDCFGHVTSKNIADILTAVDANNTCVEGCYRGNSFAW